MAPRVIHAKVSTRPAGNDPGRIYGPDWNDDHVIEGLTIGADIQAHDATLDALAALDSSTGLLSETGADTFAKRALTGTASRVSVTNGDGAAGNPTVDIDAAYAGQVSIVTVGTITTGTWNGSVVAEAHGGTHQSSYVLGDILYAGASNTLSRLAGNTASTRRFLRQTGTGSISAAPAWDTLVNGDIAGAGAAFSKTDDTNVTVTLGGSASSAVVNAMSLTMGWTGSLAIGRGGTGQTSAAAARASSGLNVESFTGHGDSNYTILTTDKVVGTNAAFTASRTWTLPAANAVNPGQPVVVADFQGTVTSINTLLISRAGTDTINGGTTVTINSANGAYILWSDGTSKWTAQAIGATAASGVSTFNGRSGAVTPAQGDYSANLLTGTTTNDNATAGNIGEYVEAGLASGSAVSLSSGTAKTITSISLSAGDWDISGKFAFSLNNSTTINWVAAGISTTNNAMPSGGQTATNYIIYNGIAGVNFPADGGLCTGITRLSLSATTTVYVIAQASFGTSTFAAYGEIRARRVR